jgi:hypothetical protein
MLNATRAEAARSFMRRVVDPGILQQYGGGRAADSGADNRNTWFALHEVPPEG